MIGYGASCLCRSPGPHRSMPILSHGAASIAAAIAVTGMLVSSVSAATPGGVPAARAEVQIELCTPFPETERALKLRAHGDPVDVWLFDDSEVTLFDRGLRLRLRVSGKRAELTAKIANQDCARIDARMVPPKSGKCEYDMHGARMAGTVSLSRNLADREWRDLVAGRVATGELLSAVQVSYLRDVARIWPLPPQLIPLGPKKSRAYVPQNEPYEVDVSQLPSGGGVRGNVAQGARGGCATCEGCARRDAGAHRRYRVR